MDLVLCHTVADFDALGAAVGVTRLRPGSRIVLTGGAHPAVQDFLSIWRDEYPFIDKRAVNLQEVRSLTLVDASLRDRFRPVADWFDYAQRAALPIYIYDHHSTAEATPERFDFPVADACIETVGASTTLVVERLQQQGLMPTPAEATVMALGIHSDTGSLTFEQATVRDAAALTWLMGQGANQQIIADRKDPGLSPQLQDLLAIALDTITVETIRGHQLGWIQLTTPSFVPGLSSLAEQLGTLLGLDTLLLCSVYQGRGKASVIGRSRTHPFFSRRPINLLPIFEARGGGGHAQAVSAVLGERKGLPADAPKDNEPEEGSGRPDALSEAPEAIPEAIFESMVNEVRSLIPHPLTAQSLMSSPVRTILPETTVEQAQHTLLRYGHVGLCVVNGDGALVGMISRRDIDIALRHGLGHAPVKGCMSSQVKSIKPETSLPEIQSLMMTYDIGRLPVLRQQQLVGIVTRTDLLRQLHQPLSMAPVLPHKLVPRSEHELYQSLQERISEIWPAILLIAELADQNGWALYLVGGAVRDLLLGLSGDPYPLTDIDLVVDGTGDLITTGAGVLLAEAIESRYPQVTAQIHGDFQTASLVWHRDQAIASDAASEITWNSRQPLLIDIATARSEFYPYPASNPEVEASTIRQDLYRRDFTMNAMALRLNGSQPGELLDFFGGQLDLQQQQVRVLHANSFIEDPTRIFRAVKFATRLGFSIDAQSEQFIRYAVSSGIYAQMQDSALKAPALQTRLTKELRYLLSSPHWAQAIAQLDHLGAWTCLHRSLQLSPVLWRQLHRMIRWLNKFDVNQPQWIMLLELIIAQLSPQVRVQIGTNLGLSNQSLDRLKKLHQWENQLLDQLPQAKKPSLTYQLLRPYARPELLLISDRHPYTLGPQIWQYIVRLSQIPPLINGASLKRLGFRPGPQFRDILTAVHAATLDGELSTVQAAEAYVLAHYPSGEKKPI